MKKNILLTLLLAITLTLGACSSDITETTDTPTEQPSNAHETVEDEDVEEVDEGDTVKIAIITNAIDEELFSVQAMTEKYPGRVIHEIWPDGYWDNPEKLEKMKSIFERIAADPEVKFLGVSAIYGTNSAIDKLLETRDDIFIMYFSYAEDPKESAKRADIILQANFMKAGYDIARLAYEAGAKTLVHYSFFRHMSVNAIAVRHDIMKSECERLGIEFVYSDAPDPMGSWVDTFKREYILQDVPRKVAEYGQDTAFFSTECVVQPALIRAVMEEGAIFPSPCCPSPYQGFPSALKLDGFSFYDRDGGTTRLDAEFDNPEQMVNPDFIQATIEQIDKTIVGAGMGGRFSIRPFPEYALNIFVTFDYATKWMAGKTDGKVDLNVLRELIESYTGPGADIEPYTEEGITYDNYILYMQPSITFR